MADSVIFHTPGILLILLGALVLEELHKKKRLEGWFLPVVSALFSFLALMAAFRQGAALGEISIVLCIFLALYLRGEGENP